MAPEMTSDDGYDEKVDIFSFGMVLWEIVSSQSLLDHFRDQIRNKLVWMREVAEGKPPRTDGMNPTSIRILQKCWDSRPSRRWTFTEILAELSIMRYSLFDNVHEAVIKEYTRQFDEFESSHPQHRLGPRGPY
jgi:serine/threonine protein kinase